VGLSSVAAGGQMQSLSRRTGIRRLLAASFAVLAILAAGVLQANAKRITPIDDPLVFGDTVVVWGPVTMDDPGSNNEEFVLDPQPGRQYLLKVENGLSDGSQRMTKGSVRFNGYKLITDDQVAAGAAGWLRRILPIDSNWVRVQIDSPANAIVKVSILETIDPTVTVFETRMYPTSVPGPTTVFHALTIPSGVGEPFYLCMANGNQNGTNRYDLVQFNLDGVPIADTDSSVPLKILEFPPSTGDSLRVRGWADSMTAFVDVCIKGTDTADPTLTIAAPTVNFVTRDSLVTISGTVLDSTATAVTVNGVVATLGSGNSWSADVPIVEGPNTLVITAIDAAGNQSDTSRVVHRDETPPDVTITLPVADGYTLDTLITLVGTATDASTFTLNVNGTPVTVDENGDWSVVVAAPNEVNVYVVTATDVVGNAGSAVRIMGRDLTDPTVTVTAPVNNDTTDASGITVEGTVVDSSAVLVTVNGDTVAVVGGAFEHMVPLLVGTNTVLVIATDAFGNVTTVSRTVVRTAPGSTLPPDPSTVASAIDPTQATNLFTSMQFLWTGATPIQTGVDSGTIKPKQVIVVRGKVLDGEADPLADATVTVLNHPEFGQTRSRADGQFDLATNGGGAVTVEIGKPGYLPVQRTLHGAPWQQWVTLDSVVLTALDTNVTTIDFTDSIQVARGSVMTDSAGTRQGTLLFRQGTTASIKLPNGSLQSVSTLNVRITEFTAGPLGPAAMPGELPASTAYTYAAELTTDEATAAGAREVLFSQPVSFYLENFLNFRLGAVAPVGYYDRDLGAWKPEPDGRVISIVSITSGRANVAVDSMGVAASQAVLDSLGITDAERGQLASLYAVGDTLWRVPLTHFSAVDVNTPLTPPDNSTDPSIDPNRLPDRNDNGSPKCKGCIISVQNQTLGEALAVSGTPFTLHYSSDRALGFRPQRRITIPGQHRVDTAVVRAAGGSAGRNGVALHVKTVYYMLEVAGRRIVEGPVSATGNFPAVTLEWDGLDAAGRRVNGEQNAKISVSFGYPDKYAVRMAVGGSGGRSFGQGRVAGMVTTGTEVRRIAQRIQVWRGALGTFDARAQGLGGWTLSAHHTYVPATGTLYQGDGTRRDAPAIGQSMRPLVSGGVDDIAVRADGSFYQMHGNAVSLYGPDGTLIRRVAGLGFGSFGYSGDDVRADSSRLNNPAAIAVGPDGLLYIADRSNNRIRRVDADGVLRTFAGSHLTTSSGDGGHALQAGVQGPLGIAFLPDGSLLFTETLRAWVRRIAPNGIVSRFAGTGNCCNPTGDTGPATSAAWSGPPIAIATGPDGSAYILHGGILGSATKRIRRVRPDGIMVTLAGGLTNDTINTPARSLFLGHVGDMQIAPNGDLYFTDGGRLHAITPSGRVRIVAGVPGNGRCTGSQSIVCDPADPMTGGLGLQFKFRDLDEMAFAPDGAIILSDRGDGLIRTLSPALPGFNENDILIASEDGGAVYHFNQYGRHLRTMDAMTRDTVLEFAYDSAGWLTSVADADGEVTTIERTGALATAIVGPDGHRTELDYDANGFLDEVLNPLGERVTLVTSASGLLQSVTDPRNGVSAFAYDTLGRLVSDSSAASRVQTIARAETDTSSTVTLTDDLSRSTTFRLDRFGRNWERRTTTDPAGLVTTSTTFANDSTVSTTPDGSTMMVVNSGDSRFGAQAPVLKRAETRLPSGLTSIVIAGRRVRLTNVADPLSLDSLRDSVVVNGRRYLSQYSRANRTLLTTSPMGRTTTTVYDTAGRVVSATVPGIQTSTFSYDARGRLTQAQNGGRVSTFAYDAKGRLLSTTDPLNRRDSLFYDDADRLTRRVLPDGRAVTFAYDSAGNLTSVDPPGKPAHTFTYAPADRLATYNPPTNGLGTSATSYGYNTAGQVTVIRRPTADSISFGYDAAGRPSSVAFDRGTIGFTYSGTTGNLTSLSAPGSLGLAFTYDGSLPTSVTWSGTVSGSTAVTYNSDFRVTAQTVNGSHAVSFGYDLDGLLTQAGALGLRRDSTKGRLDADSITVASATQKSGYSYDAHGALSAMVNTRGADTLFTTSYTRDSLSRIVTLTERVNGTTQVMGFTYDSVGRLSTVTRNSVLTANYTYDLNGNRATKVTSGGTETALTDDQDRLTSYGGTSYEYTNNGELRRKIVGTDTTEYTYDALGNLTEVVLPDGTEIGYLIDVLNRRIGKTVNDTLVRAWLHQGQLTPVAELDGSGNVVSRFVYATGINVPDYMVRGDSTYRLIRDHLGSVRLVVNVGSGAVAQRLAYDEFGITTENTNADWQPFGYAGGLTDSHTGLIRFGARDYDAVAGRWTAKDPIGFAGGITSFYSYVANDPVNAIDPTGTVVETALDIVSVGLSLWDFLRCPSWANAGWLGADVLGAVVPFLPSLGTVRRTAKWADAARGGRGLGAKAPDQITSGVRQLEGQYVDDVGQVQPWRAQYDEYGRQVERTDFTDLPDPSTHTNPHHHMREYGPGYGRKGKETLHPGPGPNTGGGQ
jgi:RHS repeat-associated protein